MAKLCVKHTRCTRWPRSAQRLHASDRPAHYSPTLTLETMAYLAGLFRESAHEGMAIPSAAGAFIVVLDDDSLFSGVPPLKDDNDLARLHKREKVKQPATRDAHRTGLES